MCMGQGSHFCVWVCKYKEKAQIFHKASLAEKKEFEVVGKDDWVFPLIFAYCLVVLCHKKPHFSLW